MTAWLALLRPYATAIFAVAWVLSLIAFGAWQRHDGAVAERTDWQERDNQTMRDAHALIERLQATARQAEQDHAMEMAAVGASMERRIGNVDKQRAADRAAVSNGTLRLYDRPAGLAAGSCGVPAPLAAAGERDGRAAGELSGAAAADLLDLVNDADLLAGQLAECQAIVRRDRELTGANPQ